MEDVKISGKTKVFGIIGYPIEHSLSPIFQAEFFRQFSVDGVYVPFAVVPDKMHEAIDGLLALGVEGFNVTVPHKESVCQYILPDTDAEAIGAVNTVRRKEDGLWEGTNTDWRGILGVLQGLDSGKEADHALLFGAGGTARAVLHALASLGTQVVYLCNRSQGRLMNLLDHARERYPDTRFIPLAWEQRAVDKVSATCEVVMNTTSIGMGETAERFPFRLRGDGIAVDTVYTKNGDLTAFCASAVEGGRKTTVDGLPLLVAQGAESFAFWYPGRRPDRLATLRWLERSLGRRVNAPMKSWEAL